MIVIQKPFIEKENEFVRIAAKFQAEDINDELWYRVPAKFEKFLVTENLDAFLVALLFLALKNGEDIKVEGAISARLLYSVNHYLIPALRLANPKYKAIKVIAKEVNEKDLNTGRVAGTGLSCGVDSFATYYDHINEEGPYKIEFFTFFNAGSHGSGGEKTRKVFHKRLKEIQKFADKAGKEVITVDSNLSEILMMKFQRTNTLRNASCVLLLQKLFKNYYSASKNRFDYFKLHNYDTQDYDSLTLNLLSTESTNFFSAVANFTRVERTDLISNFEKTYDHLNVCTSPHSSGTKINCSKCRKCQRTALTLDLLGKLHLYDRVFDLKTYEEHKDLFIGHIIASRNDNQINGEIFALLKEKKQLDYVAAVMARAKLQTSKIKDLL